MFVVNDADSRASGNLLSDLPLYGRVALALSVAHVNGVLSVRGTMRFDL